METYHDSDDNSSSTSFDNFMNDNEIDFEEFKDKPIDNLEDLQVR